MEPYFLFENPRTALFAITGGKYLMQSGWEITYKKFVVIAEDNYRYITEFRECREHCPDGIKPDVYTIRIGIHKSRLVKWIGMQMALF